MTSPNPWPIYRDPTCGWALRDDERRMAARGCLLLSHNFLTSWDGKCPEVRKDGRGWWLAIYLKHIRRKGRDILCTKIRWMYAIRKENSQYVTRWLVWFHIHRKSAALNKGDVLTPDKRYILYLRLLWSFTLTLFSLSVFMPLLYLIISNN